MGIFCPRFGAPLSRELCPCCWPWPYIPRGVELAAVGVLGLGDGGGAANWDSRSELSTIPFAIKELAGLLKLEEIGLENACSGWR